MIEQFKTGTNDFSLGLITKLDPTDLPMGAAQAGQNVMITDDSKIAPSLGAELFGVADTSATPIISAHTFKRADGVEIPIRSSGTIVEYYHEGTAAWENLAGSFTTGRLFGWETFNETLSNDGGRIGSFVYGCNNIEPYFRWSGSYTQLNGALSGGEATITVDSVLEDKVYYSGTASAVTTTTVTIATADWGTNLWNSFYVLITSGGSSGRIEKISATTSTQITFDTLSGLSGTPTFEIRLPKYADSGSLRIGTTDVAYTTMDTSTTFNTCTNTPAAADNAAVTQVITKYPTAPRGDILKSLTERMYVASRDKSSVFVSNVSDATLFTFSAPRAAGEGDIIDFVEGGGALTGMGVHEDTMHILKADVIKQLDFTQDANDLANTKPVISSPLVGPLYPLSVFNVDNALFFASGNGGVKTVQRIESIDFKQTKQLSDPIRPTVNAADFSTAAGIFFGERAYIAARETPTSAFNDIVFVFNYQKNAWELPRVGLNISCFFIYNNELYGGSSLNKETYKLETGHSIISGTTRYPMAASWTSGSHTFGNPFGMSRASSLYVEGYITSNTTLTVTLSYEYRGVGQQISGTISGTDDDYLLQDLSDADLGVIPLGVGSLGAGTEEATDRLKFRVYFTFPEIPAYEIAVSFESDGIDQDWEVLRYAFNDIASPLLAGIKQKKAMSS